MKKTLFTGCLCALIFSPGFTQDHQYVLAIKGQETGLLNVWENQQDDARIIKVETEVDANLLFFDMQVRFYLESNYRDGVLQKSRSTTYVNGKKKKDVRIRLQNGRYRIRKKGAVLFHNEPIHYSGALLYVEEPSRTQRVFSEMDGEYKRIEAAGPHEYQLTEPGSRRQNEYLYANGILKKAFIDHSLVDFEIRKK